jgi:release factor glutamine methyltransferase
LRIREILRQEKDVPRIDLIAIIGFVLSTSTERIYMDLALELPPEACLQIRESIAQRKTGKPLAYVIGTREFYSEQFLVDERVLVPRPETELLVEEAIRVMEKRTDLRVLDMGAGSGIIGVLLAQHGATDVTCIDISHEALLVARENARRLGVQDRITHVCSDLFGGIRKGQRFDVVVANLPYVSSSEWEGLMRDVRFEPYVALVGGDRGTELYERFVCALTGYLGEGGAALCEVGGDAQAERVGEAMKQFGLEVRTQKDLEGRQRVLVGSWKSSS